MKRLASLAFGAAMIAMAPGPAVALTDEYCMDQAQQTCSQFSEPGTANWAHCVEMLYDLCMNGVATTVPFDGEAFIQRYGRKDG